MKPNTTRHWYADYCEYRDRLDARYPAPEPDGTLDCLSARCDHFRAIDDLAIRLASVDRLKGRVRIIRVSRI